MKAFFIDSASGSGWGVAKVGTVTIAPEGTETVSIADLGFTSVDDYIVLFSHNSTHVSYASIVDRTTQSFTISNDIDDVNTIYYAVIAEGYGGGGGGS